MEEIFQQIRDAILANVREIKWIDIDEGQLENFELPPVDYPCLLVGFPSGRYQNVTEHLQTGDMSISVKLGFKLWEKFNAAVPLVNQPAAFDHFTIIRKVVKYLHGLPGQNRSELVRISYAKSNSPDPKIYNIMFECATYDNTTQVDYISVLKDDLAFEVDY